MQSHMAAHFKLCIMHPYIMPQILSMTVQQILCMHACMHMGSHFDLKGFFKVSLPALQVPANNQSMAASSLDPEVAFGPQQEWESPIQERPWVGQNAASMIPHDANEEQIIEAMELWGMPAEAWPQMDKKKKGSLCFYILKKKDHPDIHVYLGRQMFTTKPPHEKHTYFSFWMSLEFDIGPVANPYGIGNCVKSKGYNHCNATLAFGEIQMLAGWTDEPFLLQWHSQFNLHRNPDQLFPPVLHDWILLQPDLLHIVDLGLAAINKSTSADQLQDVHDHQAPAQPNQLPDVAPSLLDVDQVDLAYENGGATLINADEIGPIAKKTAAVNKSTSADQLQEVHDHQAPAQPDQLPDIDECMHQDASFQLLDVDQIYLTHHNGGASIINAKKIVPNAKKKVVDGKEVIKLCDDGLHRVVWEVPMAGVDCEWQCL